MKRKHSISIQQNMPWLKILVLALAILQIITPNKAWMIVLVGFGGIWLLSYIWSRQLARGLRLKREQLYGWLQVGDWLEERFTLGNYSDAPATWLSLEDSSSLPGYAASVGTGIDSNNERRWIKRTPCERRGEYHLGPVSLKTGDIFGIYSVEILYPETESFIVAPPVIPLPFELQFISGRKVDENKTTRIQAEKSISSISVREYSPGDNFAKIHWMVTAKQNEPYVRVFENIHASDTWWLLLDLDKNVQIGEDDNATDEHSIILAGSLADRALKKGKSVGLIASGEEFVVRPAKHGLTQRGEIMRSLSVIQRGTKDLSDMLLRSEKYFRRFSNVIVITSSVNVDWIRRLDYFREREIIPTVLFVASDQDDHIREIERIGELLTRRGIKFHVLNPEIFRIPEARPGRHGEVRWKFTPMGRAIMLRGDGRVE